MTVLLFGYNRNITKLLQKNNKIFSISYSSTKDIESEPSLNIYNLFHNKYPKKYLYLNYPSNKLIEEMKSSYLTYVYQHNRWTSNLFYSDLDLYNQFIESIVFWNNFIIHEKIDVSFFDEDPHRASDYIAYEVLKFYSIPSYISVVINANYRSYFKEKIEHNLKEAAISWDKIDRIEQTEKIDNLEISKNHVKAKFDDNFGFFYIIKLYLILIFKLMYHFFKALVFPDKYDRYTKLPKFVGERYYPVFYDIFLFKALIYRQFYRLIYKRISKNTKEIHLKSNDIVYYSHYFPERTSVPLSTPFGFNQIMALRILRGTNLNIYYKEHPSSLSIENNHRNYTHHNLKYIEDIKSLDIKLLEGKESNQKHIVATLNGTIGIEYALKGFKVITFGNAWYDFLPNVHKYKQYDQLIEFVKNYKVDRTIQELESIYKDYIRKNSFPFDAHCSYRKNQDNNIFLFEEICQKLIIEAQK